MSISVNLYTPGQSWLHQTDPRVKLLFVAAAIFLLILFKNVWLLLNALLLLHLLHWSAATPLAKIRFIWKTLLPVALLMLLLRVLFYPVGEPLLTVWIVQVTTVALAQGLVLALRILTMALVVFAWLYTTTQPDLVQGFVRLGMPHAWGLVLALALRYIPTFQGTFTLITEAQQARGLNVSQGSGFQRVRLMMPIFVAMIISSLRASGQLALALEARGYGRHGAARTTLHGLHFHGRDWVLTAVLLLILLTLTYLNLRHGFGSQPLLLYPPG
ncbi:MAG: energy-coupling factor transporter transmembrane protein EcfT [Anaerolineales bacterium]|nr:energy-coupling factor transporter transmembrane protein EcfT [Anaerolineales bacterium]